MEIVNLSIDQIKVAEYNARQMTEEQAMQLRLSIKTFGLVEPLVVNQHKGRENILVGGHQRLEICKLLGYAEVPVVFVDLDEQKEKELNLRLNKNLGEWDWDKLASFDLVDLKDVGFSKEELDLHFNLGDEVVAGDGGVGGGKKSEESTKAEERERIARLVEELPDHDHAAGDHSMINRQEVLNLLNGHD